MFSCKVSISPTVERLHEPADVCGGNPRVALAEHVDAEGQQHPGSFRAQGIPHSCAVRLDQVGLQQVELVVGNLHVGELAEAGGDSVYNCRKKYVIFYLFCIRTTVILFHFFMVIKS